MASLDDMLRMHRETMSHELAEAEKKAIAAGREPLDLARLERLLEANPGTYAMHEQSLRRSYYVMVTRLKTMDDLAEHVREMTVWGFWEVG